MSNSPTPLADIDGLMDRELQRTLLIRLAEAHTFETIPVTELIGMPGTHVFKAAVYNLEYLQQHGWVVLHRSALPGTEDELSAGITALGLDLVWRDGGLLTLRENTIIRLQGAVVRRLLKVHVMGSQLLPSEKLMMMECLQGLHSEALALLTLQILEQAMNDIPELWRLLRVHILAAHQIPDSPSDRY